MKLIAKIEDGEGVKNIDEILEEVDGIMVARGGLGVELGLEVVPIAQRTLIEKAILSGKIVITATQMLESMTTNPRPTRAEANDVATAIMLGTDCVMLSGESSAGEYPVEAVEFMSSIARTTEPLIVPRILTESICEPRTTDALTKAVAQMAIDLDQDISAVVVVSRSGRTAKLLRRHGIKQPIYAFVSSMEYARELSLYKGINRAFSLNQTYKDRDSAVKAIDILIKELKLVEPGKKVLLLCKTPLNGDEFFPNVFEVITV